MNLGSTGAENSLRWRFSFIESKVAVKPNFCKIANPDRDLTDKLKAEWGAILNWMVEGCAEWQRQGLNPPKRVIEETNKYLESEDSIGLWIEERCQIGAYEGTSFALFQSWKHRCENVGERPGNRKDFSKALESRGFHGIMAQLPQKFLAGHHEILAGHPQLSGHDQQPRRFSPSPQAR